MFNSLSVALPEAFALGIVSLKENLRQWMKKSHLKLYAGSDKNILKK